jgi:phosphoglycolate phosphatase
LKAHQERGGIMAVCTNKNHADALRVLERCEILPFFEYVTGGDTTAHPKPHPAPLIHTLQQLNTAPADAILIGDTHADALCAQSVRTGFVLHRAGYGGQAALDCPNDAQFLNYSELYVT